MSFDFTEQIASLRTRAWIWDACRTNQNAIAVGIFAVAIGLVLHLAGIISFQWPGGPDLIIKRDRTNDRIQIVNRGDTPITILAMRYNGKLNCEEPKDKPLHKGVPYFVKNVELTRRRSRTLRQPLAAGWSKNFSSPPQSQKASRLRLFRDFTVNRLNAHDALSPPENRWS
jgi:hypothetical protein